MAKHCEDLPTTELCFPAYGLSTQFSGYRWLVGWEQDVRGWLASVALGHGSPSGKSGFIVTYTFRKSLYERFSPPFADLDAKQDQPEIVYSAGPTGYNTAFFRAVVALADNRLPHELPSPAKERAEIIETLLEEARWDNGRNLSMNRPTRLDNKWIASEVTIDGRACAADTRKLNGRWATLVDLPSLTIMISGPETMCDLQTPLVNFDRNISIYN